MKGRRRSKRLLNHELLKDGSQENKGEALHALVDDDEDDDEEIVDSDHTRPRKGATKGTFSLTDLDRLALKPGLTASELTNGFWNLQGRLKEYDPTDGKPKNTFVTNIILGRNLEVFLEVNKSLSFGKGMIWQLVFAAVRVGDEDAVVRLVSMLHNRRYNRLFDLVSEALRIDLLDEAPHSGARALVKEIVRLKIVKPGNSVVTSYGCSDFIGNFDVLRCSKHALMAIEEELGPEVWDEVRRDGSVALTLERLAPYHTPKLARNGALEHLLRHNALVLTPKLCNVILRVAKTQPTTLRDISNPHILSFIDFYNDTFLPIMNAMMEKKEEPIMFLSLVDSVCVRIWAYDPSKPGPALEVDGFLEWVESHLSSRDSRWSSWAGEMIHLYIWTGAVDRLHSLLELLVPAESSCTMREDGLLDEPRPPLHIVKKRAEMALDAICKQDSTRYQGLKFMHVGMPLQHYLFHELQLDIERVCDYCVFRVIFLGPTSPPALVDKVLQMVHANLPKFDIDKWKELFKQGVYPVPRYFGNRVHKVAQSRDAQHNNNTCASVYFMESLGYPHVNAYIMCGMKLCAGQEHETLEYLRPWYRVCGTMLSEETKFSIDKAIEVCSTYSARSTASFRAQAMLEADMIRFSDELPEEHVWGQRKRTFDNLPYRSHDLFPIYSKWYEHTEDRAVRQMLQGVVFATACATNRISEAKQALLDMLHPPIGQGPWAQASSNRADLLTMAACTGNLPFVKWVFSQIQVAFPPEPIVSGPGRTAIDCCSHQMTIPAWMDVINDLIHRKDLIRSRLMWEKPTMPDLFFALRDHVLGIPCPKNLLEVCLLLAQTDPLAVLPLILCIPILEQHFRDFQINGRWWYALSQTEFCGPDAVKETEKDLYRTEAAWAWGPITLVKLIEHIADETTDTADTILNAKEQTQGIDVEGSWVFGRLREFRSFDAYDGFGFYDSDSEDNW